MRAAAVVWFIVGFAFCIVWMTGEPGGLFSVGIAGAVVAERVRTNRNTDRRERSG